MNNIVVLGAGSWGTALSVVLQEHNNVTLWNALPDTLNIIQKDSQNTKYLPGISLENINLEYDLAQAVQGKDMILIAIPSKFYRNLLDQLKTLTSEAQIIISATKGIELDPIRTMTELIEEIIPHKAAVALSGPSHAEEVGMQKFTCLVAASKDMQAAKQVQECFSTSWVRVYTNSDPKGVEIGAAVKNVVAIAAGIVSAGNYGDNALAALVTRGLAEMIRFGTFVGGDLQTFTGLAGIGDLIVTCYSTHSRNRYVGQQILAGKKIDDIEQSMSQIPEGVRAVKLIYQFACENNISMPIVESVYKILYEDMSLQEWENALTDRPYKIEY